MRTLLTVVLAAAAGTSVWLGAQQPPPQQPQVTFRLEADYIEVDAVVTDAQGNVVRNLQREDFEVLEDKRPQTIDVFSFVDIPLERDDRPLYRPTAVEPDVVTNERELEGRIYVLLLDSNHVPAANTYLVKKAARHFIDRYLGANDLASVVHAQTGTVDANQEFTSSKPALRAAVEKFVGEKVRSKALNVYDYMGMRFGTGFDPLEAKDPHMLERAAKADATIDAIMRVSRYMSGIRGRRKAVLLFSEGIDFNLDDTIGPRRGGLINPFGDNTSNEALHASGIRDHMQAMYEVATRANVGIFSIDPRGLASESDNLLQASGFPVDVDPGLVPQLTSSVREELRRELGTLRTFSEVTGGVAHVGTNDFDAGFRRVVLENSSYYVLGYHPAELKHDGKFHQITVRVKRPGVQVRARRGYYAVKAAAAPAPPADPTVELLNSPLALGGLGLRLTTSTMKGTAPNVRVYVTVELSGRDIALDPKNDSLANSVKLSYVALDLSGKVRANGSKTMDVSIRPETRQAIAERGLRLVTEIELPPGRYQFRVAGHEAHGGRTGSVFRDLDLPDFAKSPLTMSQLALTAASAGRVPTGFEAPSLKDLLPGPPTAVREFGREDLLAVLAEIYDNDAARQHTVDLSAIVQADDGTRVFVWREERNSRDLGSDRGAYTYVTRIPLKDFKPGTYVLTVEARSRLGGDPATREIQFSVK